MGEGTLEVCACDVGKGSPSRVFWLDYMGRGNPTWASGLTVLAALGAAGGVAHAGVEAWRVNEVGAEPRLVELYAPPSELADNCFFPSTRLEVLDGAGGVVGTVQPFSSTVCFAGDTYFLFAPAGGDASLPYALDASGGQVCVRSGTIRYDCVRWGAIRHAVVDQEAPADTSAAPAMGAGQSLARVSTTGVVASDFVLGAPTPRAPNDGSPWFPPDAGPPPVDAAGSIDAWPADDAEPVADAPVPEAHEDARLEPPGFLNAAPGGGGCGVVRAGQGGARRWLVLVGVVGLLRWRRKVPWWRSARRRAPAAPSSSCAAGLTTSSG